MTDFATLARQLDPDLTLSSARSFELVLDEGRVVCRVSQAPDSATIVADYYLRDVSSVQGGGRTSLNQSLLAINGLAPFDMDYSVGVDTRGFVVLTGRRPMAGLTGDMLGEALARWLEIASDVAVLAEAASGRVQAVSLGMLSEPAAPTS